MIVRKYQPSDFHAILDLINTAATADHTARISEVGLASDLNPETAGRALEKTAVAVADDGAYAGFAWWDAANFESVRLEGWVHPARRRKGIGTALLTAVESFLRKRLSGGQVTLKARAFADIEGAEPLFRLKGYHLGRRFFTMFSQLPGRVFDVEVPDGVTFRSFRAEDLDALVEADNEIFNDHWGSLPQTPQSFRRRMVERRPHDPKLWTIAWAGDQVIGECLCHTSTVGGPNDGWVSIVGVQREWRGRGLGRALLARGLQKLQEVGFETASLNVDAENSAAINLYRSLGMDVVRTRLHFAKTIQF